MAYDRVIRKGLFKCMRELGFPKKLIRLVAMCLGGSWRNSHGPRQNYSRESEINKGLRQGKRYSWKWKQKSLDWRLTVRKPNIWL
uniref:Uncharacterized protein n=1 Tax=Rhodnius prolixus TaxID=13249 RepID=T1HA18_RHOPR